MSLSFRTDRDLLSYLGSQYGIELLIEAADTFCPYYRPREKVLVKAYRDGLIEVYGPKNVDAKIVLLGRSITYPGCEIMQEELVDYQLSQLYRLINYPGYCIASALWGHDRKVDEALFTEETGTSGPSGTISGGVPAGAGEVRVVPEEAAHHP